MTNREAIDKMIEYFSKPGAVYGINRSSVTNPYRPSCVYRLNDDASSEVRCSVGVLIPDEEYNPSLEGEGVESIAYDVPSLEGLELSLLISIQARHDSLAFEGAAVEQFVNYLKNIYAEVK